MNSAIRRFRPTKLSGLFLLAMLAAPAAVAAPPGFDQHMQNALQAIAKKDAALADKEVEAAEKALGPTKPADESSQLLLQRGLIRVASGRPREAVPFYTQSINTLIKAFGPKSSKLGIPYAMRGLAYCDSDGYKEAAADLASSFALMQPDKSNQAPIYLRELASRVTPIRIKLGGGPLIMPMLVNGIAAMERCGLGTARETGSLITMLGDTYKAEGKIQEAEAKFRKAIEIFAAAKADDDELSLRLALAALYEDQGRFADADEQIKPALAIADRVFGAKSTQAAKVLERQGILYCSWGKVTEGEAKLKKALVVLEKDPNNPEQMFCWMGLSSAAQSRGDLAEAENAMKQAFAFAEKSTNILPEDASTVDNAMADVLIARNKYVEAEAVLNKSLQTAQKVAAESPLVADAYASLAKLNLSQGKYKEAEDYIMKALIMRRNLFGDINRLVARDLRRGALIYDDQKLFTKSAPCYDLSLQILNKVAPENDFDKIRLLECWGLSENAQAKYSDAEKRMLQAAAMAEVVFGKDSRESLSYVELLGKNDFDAGKYEQAETRLLQVLTKLEKLDGPTSPSLGSVLTHLLHTYNEMGNATMAQEIQARLDKIKGALPGAPPAVVKANPVITDVAEMPKSGKPVANKWAVVIGISNFRDSSINLKYGAKDAKDFANFLVAEQNFKPENVKLLIDENANRMNIADALGEGFLVRNAREDDLVVIFVSSHGGADITKSSGRNFLCSYESNAQNLLMTGITMEWFSQYLTDRVPAQRVVVFLDVCHSGAITGDKGLTREQQSFDVLSSAPGRGQIFIASSLASQLSWESKRYENGVFTHSLMDALRANGRQTKLSEAFDRLRKQVEDEVLSDRQQMQTPLMKRTWNGDDVRLSETSGTMLVNTGAASPSAQPVIPTAMPAANANLIFQPSASSQPTAVQAPVRRLPARAPVLKVPPVPGSQDDF